MSEPPEKRAKDSVRNEYRTRGDGSRCQTMCVRVKRDKLCNPELRCGLVVQAAVGSEEHRVGLW